MNRQLKEREQSNYVTDDTGAQFFLFGSTKIRVTEHFCDGGKPIGELIKNAVEYAANSV